LLPQAERVPLGRARDLPADRHLKDPRERGALFRQNHDKRVFEEPGLLDRADTVGGVGMAYRQGHWAVDEGHQRHG
jgi:hypothetical protein